MRRSLGLTMVSILMLFGGCQRTPAPPKQLPVSRWIAATGQQCPVQPVGAARFSIGPVGVAVGFTATDQDLHACVLVRLDHFTEQG